MAASDEGQSGMDQFRQDNLHCSICTQYFIKPKMLDCLHSFCLKCLQELKAPLDSDQSTRLVCPTCVCETTLSEKGVHGLPDNSTLSALVAESRLQETLKTGQGSDGKCQACDEGNQAVSKCMDCDHLLCGACREAHWELEEVQSHQVYLLPRHRSEEVDNESYEDVPRCKVHEDQFVCLFCNTCMKLVCTICITYEHPQHDLIGLSEACDKGKRGLQELLDEIEKSKGRFAEAIRQTDESRAKLDIAYTETIAKIQKKADDEIAKVTEKAYKMQYEAEKVYMAQVTTMDIVDKTKKKKRGDRQK
ncbi:E3 ubiquitin-protein ligase TRIM71-like [Asterias amurensis]|uniref:E3 ubiquitin-protein ligase TRIM71-like n=1 Tax=Asterias amurensis TaxID=7602 RepID=UPI003AB3390F